MRKVCLSLLAAAIGVPALMMEGVALGETVRLVSTDSKFIEAKYRFTKDKGRTRNFVRAIWRYLEPDWYQFSKTQKLEKELFLTRVMDRLSVGDSTDVKHGDRQVNLERISKTTYVAEYEIPDRDDSTQSEASEPPAKTYKLGGVWYRDSGSRMFGVPAGRRSWKKSEESGKQAYLVNVNTGEGRYFPCGKVCDNGAVVCE